MGLLDFLLSRFLQTAFGKGSFHNNYFYSYYQGCVHRICDRHYAILYCIVLVSSYVGALYVLVPLKIRKLPRDHHIQIQYRSMTSILVCVVAMLTYPYLFCTTMGNSPFDTEHNITNELFSLQSIMFRTDHILAVLIHTMILYLGPIVASLLRVYEIRNVYLAHGKMVESYPMEVFHQLIQPHIHSLVTPDTKDELWKNIRNYVVGPWTEEIIFRGCMIPPLLASGMKIWQVSLMAPLFFGFAHVHHAISRIAHGERLLPVVFLTLLQFVYTSLFGMYASYAFIRTRSILAVTASHVYCNWMGLPDLNLFFVPIRHPMYRYRNVLLASFFIGVFSFKWVLQHTKTYYLLPPPTTWLQKDVFPFESNNTTTMTTTTTTMTTIIESALDTTT